METFIIAINIIGRLAFGITIGLILAATLGVLHKLNKLLADVLSGKFTINQIYHVRKEKKSDGE